MLSEEALKNGSQDPLISEVAKNAYKKYSGHVLDAKAAVKDAILNYEKRINDKAPDIVQDVRKKQSRDEIAI